MRRKCPFIVILHLTLVIDIICSGNDVSGTALEEQENMSVTDEHNTTPSATTENSGNPECPDNVECSKLSGDCLDCDMDYSCIYGEEKKATCQAKPSVICTGIQTFQKSYKCQYCYQTERWEQHCSNSTDCKVVTAPLEKYMANCSIKDDIICLGKRKFHRMLPCNWTSGKRWSIALILSITLGGFGADRFYLGHWRAGIGKLFSFGGLGVWTIVDVILVASGYVGPADHSLYIF